MDAAGRGRRRPGRSKQEVCDWRASPVAPVTCLSVSLYRIMTYGNGFFKVFRDTHCQMSVVQESCKNFYRRIHDGKSLRALRNPKKK